MRLACESRVVGVLESCGHAKLTRCCRLPRVGLKELKATGAASQPSQLPPPTHRLRTRHHSVSPGTPRYCRNHLSLLTESIPATVSIPLAGRPTAPTRPHLSTTSVSRHQRATRIEFIKATTGIISAVTTKWRTEGLRAAAEEARLTQIAPCYRGGSRQQRKSSTKNAANRESEEKQCTRVILACTRT